MQYLNLPSWLQSSTDPTQVSLTVTSVGKAGAGLITFLAVTGLIDPSLASSAAPIWANFVAQVITAIPVGYGVWHAGQAVYGVMRKIGVRVLALFSKSTIQSTQTM